MQIVPRFLSMLAIASPLMACSTAAERQYAAMGDSWRNAATQGDACVARVQGRPEFDAIRHHLADQPTAAELADTAMPTAAEAELLRTYTGSVAGCMAAVRTQLSAANPAAGPAVGQMLFDLDSIDADLIMRKITWADAARRRQQVKAQDGAAILAANTATMRSLVAQHQQELAERQAFSDRLVTGLATAAAIYAETHPVPPPSPIVVDGPTHCNGSVDRSGNIQAICN